MQAFTIGCGFAQSSAQLIVFRALAGAGGCAPLVVGAAVIGDLYAPAERGSAMALYMGLQVGGPAVSKRTSCLCRCCRTVLMNLCVQVGPIIGAWVAQTIDSWRWIFYVCAIATAIALIFFVVLLPETFAPKLNGVKQARTPLSRPIMLLGTQPVIQVLCIRRNHLRNVLHFLDHDSWSLHRRL